MKLAIILAVLFFALPAHATSIETCLDEGDCELVENFGSSFGCVGSDSDECRWDAIDYGLQGTLLALTAIDWATTQRAINQNRPGWREANPILGPHPSQGKLAAYNLGVMAGHAVIAALLPKPWRTIWQGLWIGIGVDTMVIWGGSVYFPW